LSGLQVTFFNNSWWCGRGDSDRPNIEILECIQQFESLNPPEPAKWADRDT
jgi:hypothetical protein